MNPNPPLSVLLLVVGRPSSAWKTVTESLEITVKKLFFLKIVELKEQGQFLSINQKVALETQMILERLASEEKSLPKPIFRLLLSPKATKQFFLETELFNLSKEYRSFVIVIGGSNGVSEEEFPNFLKLSLSHLTFSHSLTRVVLLELLKRTFLPSKAFRK